MLKSLEMKLRSSHHIGLILITSSFLTPAISAEEETEKVVLIYDPPKPDLNEMVNKMIYKEPFFQISSEIYEKRLTQLFSVKPIAWFIQNKIPLCSVSTVPYERDMVHKPPWYI